MENFNLEFADGIYTIYNISPSRNFEAKTNQAQNDAIKSRF